MAIGRERERERARGSGRESERESEQAREGGGREGGMEGARGRGRELPLKRSKKKRGWKFLSTYIRSVKSSEGSQSSRPSSVLALALAPWVLSSSDFA